MELIVDGVPEEPFRRAFKAVRKRFPDLDDLPNLKVYAVSEGKELDLPLTDIPSEVAYKFQKILESADTSFFYGDENQNLVVIRITSEIEFILKNNLALRGLLAHELIHALQRFRGLDRDVKRCYIAVANEMAPLLDELDYDEESVMKLINSIGVTSILVLKDLYVDDEMIRKGLTRELLNYYSGLFGVRKKTCPLPKFKKIIEGKKISEEDFPYIVDALNFELQLLPTWLPFEKINSKVARKLKKHIEKCYEADLGWIAKHFHEIIVLYMTEFSNTCKFHRDYYRLIFNRVLAILAGIDQFSFHIREALDVLNTKEGGMEESFILSNLIKALYKHLRDKRDKDSIQDKKELEKWMKINLSKIELEEFMASDISKTDLLKVPILWSVRKARIEFAESPRSDFIDVAYYCTEAASDTSNEKIFEKASEVLTTLNVFSPYKFVGDLLKLEFRFEKNIFGRSPKPIVATKLMNELKKRAILPDNESIPIAKEIINVTFRTRTKTPEYLALFYVSLLKLSSKDSDLIESTLLAMGYKLDFIHIVNKEIARLT
jgi:hypothetical protein